MAELVLTARVEFATDFLGKRGGMEIPIELSFDKRDRRFSHMTDVDLSYLEKTRAVRIYSERSLPIQRGDSIVIHTTSDWIHKGYIEAGRIDVLNRDCYIVATYYDGYRPKKREG